MGCKRLPRMGEVHDKSGVRSLAVPSLSVVVLMKRLPRMEEMHDKGGVRSLAVPPLGVVVLMKRLPRMEEMHDRIAGILARLLAALT